MTSTIENPIVLGRCLWALGRINFNSDQANVQVSIMSFIVACSFISDSHRSIRLMAAQTMSRCAGRILREKKAQELKLAMEQEGANIDLIYDIVVALAADTNDYTVTIFLNAVVSICKIYPHLIVRTTKILSQDILVLYGRSYTDPVVSGSILDLIVMIIENPEAG